MAAILKLSDNEPKARLGHCAAFIGEKAYLFGGCMNGHYLRSSLRCSMEAFDPYCEKWEVLKTKGAPPTGLYMGAFTALKDLLYMIGGLESPNEDIWHNSVHCFDPSQLEWKKISPKNPESGPMIKIGFGLVPFCGKYLALFGGMAKVGSRRLQESSNFVETLGPGKGLVDEFHILDVEEACWIVPDTITGDRPPPCSGFSFTSVDEQRAVLFGGKLANNRKSSDVFIMDMETMKWTRVGPPSATGGVWPAPRSMHQACCINVGRERPHLLMVGGVNERGETLGDAWLFDVDGCSWTQVPLPREFASERRCLHTLTATSLGPTTTQVLLFGGCSQWLAPKGPKYPVVASTAILTLKLEHGNWVLAHATKHLGSRERIREKFSILLGLIPSSEERLPTMSRASATTAETSPSKEPFWVVEHKEIELTDRELGRGAWAVVQVANFRGLQVAAKCMHEAIVSTHNRGLFVREINLASRVRHPNLLQFIGATLHDFRQLIILTELMPNNLRAVLADQKVHLPLSHTMAISRDIALALNYLHLMKPDAIVHRDISSANILLEPLPNDGWKAKVSDYGSANISRQFRTVGPGCAAYAAPEASDPARQSTKMDIFSFGVLLIEICTRKFPDADAREGRVEHIRGDETKLVPLIQSCLSDQSWVRPSAHDLLASLSKL